MGMLLLLAGAVVSALCESSHAVCSPCPFQWVRNQNNCYRYFPEDLSYEEAVMFCESDSIAGHVAELATVTSLEELTFIMEYIDRIFVNVSSTEVPKTIWLRNNTETSPDVKPILHRALGPLESSATSCDSTAMSGDWYQLAGNQSLAKLIPAPDVVNHQCAVYAQAGSYLDFGDFKDTCISDPGLCENMTWSLWLKIDTSSGFTGRRYYISSGGQTRKARGIAFLFQNNLFELYVQTSNYHEIKAFDQVKIPKNKWIHLTLDIEGITGTDGALQLFVNGVSVERDQRTEAVGTFSDDCTKFYMGMTNSCSKKHDPHIRGGSAAYSDLTVFVDGLLTEQQRENIYLCGSYEWNLMVRSLVMKSDLEFKCTASDPSGPIITWSLYHKQTDSWENLDASGDGYTIQSVNVSTCVVRSTLVMSSSQVSPAAIACTALAGSNNASVLIYKGHEVTSAFSDNEHSGISLWADSRVVQYTRYHDNTHHHTMGRSNPFICKLQKVA